jgi:hypothetical protein
MRGSLETPEIVRLLQEFEQLDEVDRDSSPVVGILAQETGFPELTEFLCSELLEKRRDVYCLAEQLVSYQPKSAPAGIADRMVRGALIGTGLGVGTLTALGFILGGISRASPCGSAPDFYSGGFWGLVFFIDFLGLPVVVGSLVIGALFGAILKHDSKEKGCPVRAG